MNTAPPPQGVGPLIAITGRIVPGSMLGMHPVADLVVGVGESHASSGYPRAARRHPVDLKRATLGHALSGEQVQVNSSACSGTQRA